MTSERDAILRAFQQHLLGAAEQLGKLIEVEQDGGDFQMKFDPAKVQAQVASTTVRNVRRRATS